MRNSLLTMTVLLLVLMFVLPKPQQAMNTKLEDRPTDSLTAEKRVDAADVVLLLENSRATRSGHWSFEDSRDLAEQALVKRVLLVRQQFSRKSGAIPMDEQWPDFQLPEGQPDCSEAGNVILDLASHCGSRVLKKGVSYGAIAALGAGGYVVAISVPILAPAVPAIVRATGIEIGSEVAKDLVYCFGATWIDRSDSSESTKEEFKATWENLIESADTIKDIWDFRSAFKNIVDARAKAAKMKRAEALKRFWDEYWTTHAGDMNAFEFSIKNGIEAIQRGVKWAGQLNKDAEDRSRAALAHAEGKISECKFEEAQSHLEEAVREGLLYREDLRRMMIENRNTVLCLERELPDIRKQGGAVAGTSSGATVTRYNNAVETQPIFEKKKTDFIKYLRGIRDRYKDVLKVISLRRDAEAAIDSCSLTAADARIKEIRDLRFNSCAYEAAQQKLDKKRAEVERDEKTINDLLNGVKAASAGSISCADIESAIQSIERLLSANPCLNALDTTAKATSLRNILNASAAAAVEMLQALGAGRTALAACDLEAARKAAGLARQALGKMKCQSTGIGAPGAADVQALENAIKSSGENIKEFERKAAELLSDATRAAANCDTTRLNSAAEQMALLIAEQAACQSANREWLKKINELAQGAFKNKPDVEGAISEGNKAAKECNAEAVRAAARKLIGFGVVCGLDPKAEADRLNAIADSIDSIETNIRVATDAVKSAIDRCDLRAAELAMGEVNRLGDAAQVRCSQLAQSVSNMVTGAFDSVEKLKSVLKASQVAAQEALQALNAGRATLASCDLEGARRAAALARQAMGRMKCPPPGTGAPVETDLQALESAIASAAKSATEKRKEFEARASKLLSDASLAASKCDLAAISSASELMAQLLKEQQAACLSPNLAWLTKIQEIAQGALKQRDDILAEINKGEKAARECNAKTVRAAAASLMGFAAVCGLDPKAQAGRLNAIANSIDSIETNIRAATDTVKAAVVRCDLRGAELRYGRCQSSLRCGKGDLPATRTVGLRHDTQRLRGHFEA